MNTVPQKLGLDAMKMMSVTLVNRANPHSPSSCASLRLRQATIASSATARLAAIGNLPRLPSRLQLNESRPNVSMRLGKSRYMNDRKPFCSLPVAMIKQSSIMACMIRTQSTACGTRCDQLINNNNN